LFDDNGQSYPHLHGILAVSGQFVYDDFLEAMDSESVEVFPTQPDVAGHGWRNYMVHEFLDTNPGHRELSTVSPGMALYFYGRCLLRETRENRQQKPRQKQTEEDSRWSQIASLAAVLSPPKRIDDTLTTCEPRLVRLNAIATLLKAASVYDHGERFTVPTSRLAGMVGQSQSQVRQDLSLLESVGIIRKLPATRGKPAEYVYEESY
jgi:hypothetical protein